MAATNQSYAEGGLLTRGTCENTTIVDSEDEQQAFHVQAQQTGPSNNLSTPIPELAQWVQRALEGYTPTEEVCAFPTPHLDLLSEEEGSEMKNGSGQQGLRTYLMTKIKAFQISLHILLKANKTDDPVDWSRDLHSSNAARDDHMIPWCELLVGETCKTPILGLFPFYLLLCKAYSGGEKLLDDQINYKFSMMSGVDWFDRDDKSSEMFHEFSKELESTLYWKPNIDDSYWRIANAYLATMARCEMEKQSQAGKAAGIDHGLPDEVVVAARAFDGITDVYMASSSGMYYDDEGVGSFIGTALANDVFDLHTDILTRETRNLIRLLAPKSQNIDQALDFASSLLSSILCEFHRGYARLKQSKRGDGGVAFASPAYGMGRARHRRVFQTVELYADRHPKFWDWNQDIYTKAKLQLSETAIREPLVEGLIRGAKGTKLPPSAAKDDSQFFLAWRAMIEDEKTILIPDDIDQELADILRKLHTLWHDDLRATTKKAGWGRELDEKSDQLLGEAGKILGKLREKGAAVQRDAEGFADVYMKLSTSFPYVVYHTIAAIILAYGVVQGKVEG
ncbi:hypothetical protein F5B22DRAFT_7045 [Xylaria bambusicola]|uniref:uncharacterized protein n=1 Tax=Xylaria bambusicola TaxID=326684 RepID=UPI002008E62A|nr:uncharacterized protein F5B22DRAFT_7045 [Xylaria bambusicola]KAI0527852.1 hypothetical protein F5B22DRAFT_7045 [Xylaria bambusicola]